MNEPNWEDVIPRLHRLENQNRLLSLFVGSIGVLAVGFACLQDPVGHGVFDVVTAKEIRLVDSGARVRGVLGRRTYGADDRFSAVGLTLFGEDGKEKVQLLADDTGSHSNFSLGDGVSMSSGFFNPSDGYVTVGFTGDGITISADGKGASNLTMGSVRDGIMISADRESTSASILKNGKPRAALLEDDEGTPLLVFLDASGRRRSPP